MCIVHVSRRPFRGKRWALTHAAKALLTGPSAPQKRDYARLNTDETADHETNTEAHNPIG
jgi:hypothetical protein